MQFFFQLISKAMITDFGGHHTNLTDIADASNPPRKQLGNPAGSDGSIVKA